jgi:hypothetical protein
MVQAEDAGHIWEIDISRPVGQPDATHSVISVSRRLSVWALANDDDFKDLPHINKVTNQAAYIDKLQPNDVDDLAVEITEVLERCSAPETNLSARERGVNRVMIAAVIAIDNRLSKSSSAGSVHAGAMLRLFRKTILTPKNLKALLLMTDSDRRTGRVRCSAIALLERFACVSSLWNVKLDSGSYFSSDLTSACAKYLSDEKCKECIAHIDDKCECPHKVRFV